MNTEGVWVTYYRDENPEVMAAHATEADARASLSDPFWQYSTGHVVFLPYGEEFRGVAE